MKTFWKSDWFLSLVVVIAVFVFYQRSDLIPSLESKAYDLGSWPHRISSSPRPGATGSRSCFSSSIAAYLIAAAAAAEGGPGARYLRRAIFVALLVDPFRAHDGERHVAAAHAARDAAPRRPRRPRVQALHRHRGREDQVGRDLGGVEPHAGHRLPGAGPARSRLGQVPPCADGGRRDGQHVQPGARLRAEAAVQQGGIGVPPHGGVQSEVPRPGGASRRAPRRCRRPSSWAAAARIRAAP